MQPTVIAPSILSANFARLGEEVDSVLRRGRLGPLRLMDNHYGPTSRSVRYLRSIAQHGVTAPIDVHLMVQPVDRIVADFAKAGASLIASSGSRAHCTAPSTDQVDRCKAGWYSIRRPRSTCSTTFSTNSTWCC